MTAKAVQISITHVALAIVVGSVIEGVLPRFNDGASLSSQLFETATQVGLNGAALAAAVQYLGNDDPTAGATFGMALSDSQPELSKRIAFLSALVKSRVSLTVRQMAGPVKGA